VPWAYAYNEYLKDGSKMLKALSMFAWQLKSKSKAGGTAAARTVAAFQSFAFTGNAPFILNGGDADRTDPAATLILKGGGASR
jgi:hypothetical protein